MVYLFIRPHERLGRFLRRFWWSRRFEGATQSFPKQLGTARHKKTCSGTTKTCQGQVESQLHNQKMTNDQAVLFSAATPVIRMMLGHAN